MNRTLFHPAAMLWSRFGEWVRALRQPQDMSLEWSCCGTPMSDAAEAYLGRIDSHELSVHTCTHCGTFWLGSCSLATHVMRFEPLALAEAEAFLAATPGIERRTMMRAWLERRMHRTDQRTTSPGAAPHEKHGPATHRR
ncbi:hypothetical protein DBV14_28770 [Variovorax sp. KBW07]|uniref:hypothetical protein n=1 Tax=Variovorax sp. KBW07 TaxID=2153358 RepID=UPI000F55D8AD|nr:hypothetical protein [Variovorax sp. KBW07]RQO41165.1 hypothetical protein DBV14_28770 [Variovorax sp. KBW07]